MIWVKKINGPLIFFLTSITLLRCSREIPCISSLIREKLRPLTSYLLPSLAPPTTQEDEEFTKTSCYHYFHISCLARFVLHHRREREGEGEREEERERERWWREEEGGSRGAAGGERENTNTLGCPVCREPISEGKFSL